MNKQMVGVFLALVTMIVARVGAADLYWSANGTTQGGAGTWNTSDTRWGSSAGGPFGATWNNGNTVTAIFGGTAGTVTLGVSITNGGLQFNTTGYTISIGANNLAFGAADNAITLNNIGTATITGTVGGTGNVIVSSSNPATAGTLAFTGATSGGWSGTTTIGPNITITLDGANSLNRNLLNTSGITLNGGRISSGLIANDANGAANRISDAANWTVNSGSFTWGRQDANGTIAETIGTVTLNRGQMNISLNGNMSSGSQTLTLSGLVQSGTAVAAFANAAAAFDYSGGNSILRVSGVTISTPANQIMGPWAIVGSSTTSFTDYARYQSDGVAYGYVRTRGIAASAQDSWTTAANAYTMDSAQTLGGTRIINALRHTGGAVSLALGNYNLETYGILNGGSGALTVSTSGTGCLTTPTGGGNLHLMPGSKPITVSAPISDNGGSVTLVKSGRTDTGADATLTLSSTSSTYTGGTILNAGMLAYSADTALGASGSRNITFSGSASLSWGFDTSSLGTLTINTGAVATLASLNSITFATTTGSGNVLASGGQNKTVSLGDASSFTGDVVLAYNANNNSGTTTPHVQFAKLNDAVGSAIQIYRRGGGTDSGQIGIVALTGNSGALTFGNRQIQLLPKTGGTGQSMASIYLLSNNGTVGNKWVVNTSLLNSYDRDVSFYLAGSNIGDNEFAGTIGNSTYGGTFSSGNGTLRLVKDGAGTWILSGNNTYSGGTTVSAGTLKANAANALGTGNVTLSVGTLQLQAANAVNGNVTVSAGTLVIDTANAIADTATLSLPSASAKNITMNANDTVGKLILAGVQQPNGTYSAASNAGAWMNGTGVLTVGPAAAQPMCWDLNGSDAGAGGATPAGTWNAANSYWNDEAGTGSAVAWSEGATAVFAAGADATGAYTVTVDSTRDISGLSFDEGNITLSGGTALRLMQDSVANVAPGLTATISMPVSQDVAGRGLAKTGAGSLILSAANTFSGTTTVSAGTLQLTDTSALGSSSALSLANGSTLALRSDSSATFATPVAGAGVSAIVAGATVTVDVNNNGSGTGNTLTINGGIRLVAPGSTTTTMNLAGGNGYTLNVPTFSYDQTGASSVLTLSPNSVSIAIGTLAHTWSGAAALLNLSGTSTGNSISAHTGTWLQIDKSNTSTWTVNLTGSQPTRVYLKPGSSGNLIVNGTIKTQSQSTTSGVRVEGGVLHYNNAGAVDTSAGADAALRLVNGSLDNSSGAAITTSTYNPIMEWNGNWTFVGSNGTNSDLNLGTGTVKMNASRIVTVNSNTTLTVGGIISGNTFKLTKAGSGTLALSGANTYTGGTDINAGTLRVNGSLASAVTVNSGTLGGEGTIAGGSSSVVKSGARLAPGSTVGSLTFSSGLTLETGAILAMELGTSSDRVRVGGGTFMCPGGSGGVTVNITAAAVSIATGVYTLIDWADATPSNLDVADFTVNLPAGVAGVVSISGDTLILTLPSSGTTFRFR